MLQALTKYVLYYIIGLLARYAPLAQLDRVVHYECKGWGFESLMAHQIRGHRLMRQPLLFFVFLMFDMCKGDVDQVGDVLVIK